MIWPLEDGEYFGSKSLKGMVEAYPEQLKCIFPEKNSAALVKAKLDPNKVSVIVSGGAANGPLFSGYVGQGLADACIVGAPFAAPNAYSIYESAKAVAGNKGLLLIYNNFAGDYLNNDMAKELLEMEAYTVESVVSHDDIATAVNEAREERNGRSGCALLIKLAGMASENKLPLKPLSDLLHEAEARMGTLSMVIDPEAGTVSWGSGFSGEPGFASCPLKAEGRREAVERSLDTLLEDLCPREDEEFFLLLNHYRLTSYADAYITAGLAANYLRQHGRLACIRVGIYSNIADVYGFGFSLMCMQTDWEKYLLPEVHGAGLTI